jgi:hypothetical protein
MHEKSLFSVSIIHVIETRWMMDNAFFLFFLIKIEERRLWTIYVRPDWHHVVLWLTIVLVGSWRSTIRYFFTVAWLYWQRPCIVVAYWNLFTYDF